MSFTIYKGVNPVNLPSRMRFNAVLNIQEKIESFLGYQVYLKDFHYDNSRGSFVVSANNGQLFESTDYGVTWVNFFTIPYGRDCFFLDDENIACYRTVKIGSYYYPYVSLYNYRTSTLVEDHSTGYLNGLIGFSIDKENQTVVFVFRTTNLEYGRVFAANLNYTGDKIIPIYGNRYPYEFGENYPRGAFYGVSVKNNILALAFGGGLYIKNIVTEAFEATSTVKPTSTNNTYCNYLTQDNDNNLYCCFNNQTISKLDASDYVNNPWVSGGVTPPWTGTYLGGISIINGVFYTWNHYGYSPDGFVWRGASFDSPQEDWKMIDNMVDDTTTLLGYPVSGFRSSDSQKYYILTSGSQILMYSLK